jgi:hypothetical protein
MVYTDELRGVVVVVDDLNQRWRLTIYLAH